MTPVGGQTVQVVDRAAQVERWSDELLRTGRVEIGANRRRLVLLLLVCVAFAVAGALLALQSGADLRQQVGGWSGIVFFGVIGIPAITVQIVRGGTPVVVTREQIDLGRGVVVPWSDVVGVGIAEVRRTRLVVLRLRNRQAQQRALAGRRSSQLLAPVSNAITGGTDLSLPSPLDADARALAQWLGGLVPGAR